MAITRYSTFDKTVNTIADRNAIVNKVNHMTVVVKDAIADINAGQGKAIYRWDAVDNSWILVSKSTYETVSFITEEITIANGEVQLANYPINNSVWNGVILSGQLIYADLNNSSITVSNAKITGINPDFNGYTLRVTYAYGSIAAQISSAIEDKVDAAITGNLKSINGEEILGTGNIVVTGVLPEMKTVNSQNIVGSGNIDISFNDLTSKPTTVSGYGITDAYTKAEVESKIVELAPATDISMKADISYVDSKVSNVIGLAPAQLDTLKEIADQLVTDEGAVSSLTTVVSSKANASDVYTKTQVDSSLNNKVDKISGKGLSSEDYSTTEKTKLASIASGAEVNVNADWNSTSGDSKILNKPTTVSGYGITDAYVKNEVYTKTEVDGKFTNNVPNLSNYSGDIIPSQNSVYNIGSATHRFKGIFVDEAYLSTNTLYIGDTPVLGTSQDTIVIKADPDQSISMKTLGTGSTIIESDHEVNISTAGTNADVKVQATGVNSKVRFAGTGGIELSSVVNAQSDMNISGNLTVSGNVVANGSQFLVNATTVTTKDNIITLNQGELGTGVTSGKAGIQIDRGDAADYQLIFDETDDKFKVGVVGSTLETIATREYTDTALSLKVDKIVGKGLSSEDYSTTEKTKLASIESGAQVNTVTSVSGKTGIVTLAKADVGLSDVDNTADSSKNVLSASKLTTARTINGVSFDGSANISVNTNNSEIIKFDSGTTEGTDLYSFNGSSAKTIDIKAGTNVTLTKAAGSITISANDTSVAWSEITSKPTTLSGYGITDALSTSGKAADSNLLDGIDSTEFMRKSTDNTISGNIIFDNGGTDTNGFSFRANGSYQNINVDMHNGKLRWFRDNGSTPFSIGTDGNLYSDNGVSGNGKVWTSAIDGAGSGLDADLLDGMQPTTSGAANSIAQRDTGGGLGGTYIVANNGTDARVEAFGGSGYWKYLRFSTNGSVNWDIAFKNSDAGDSLRFRTGDGVDRLLIYPSGEVVNTNTIYLQPGVSIRERGTLKEILYHSGELLNFGQNFTDVRIQNNKAWHAGNDGAGSGLDADLLDGKDSAGFMQVGYAPANINAFVTAGSYRLGANSDHQGLLPSGVDYGNLLVQNTPGTDTYTQIVTDYNSNKMYWRSGSNGAGWQPWTEIWHDRQAGIKKIGDAGYALSGYQLLPSGMMIQWGYSDSGSTTGTIMFPMGFKPGTLPSVSTQLVGSGAGTGYITLTALTSASANHASTVGYGFKWMAIGLWK